MFSQERPLVHATYARGPMRGGEWQVLLLVQTLAERGIPQVMVCRRESALYRALDNMHGVKLRAVIHHAADGFLAPRAALFHAHEARATYFAAMAGWSRSQPYVITRRVPNPLSDNMLTRAVYQRAAEVAGVSNAVCRTILSHSGRHAKTLHDAHRSLTANPEAVSRIRAEIGGGPVIGQVGALVDAHKGQSTSIGAFAAIRETFPDARLVFLGAGKDEKQFRAMASGQEGIVFAGFRDDVADWMGAFDVLVHPANEEGLGSAILDAMHIGVPVIASDVDGIPEIVENERSGMLIKPANAGELASGILRILADEDLSAALTARARAVAKAHSPDAMADAYLRLYENCLGT